MDPNTKTMTFGVIIVVLTMLVTSGYGQSERSGRPLLRQSAPDDVGNFPDFEFQPFGKVIINSTRRRDPFIVDVSDCHFKYFNRTVTNIYVSIDNFINFCASLFYTFF